MVDEVPNKIAKSCVDILLKAFGQERPASFLSIIRNDATNEVLSTRVNINSVSLTELYRQSEVIVFLQTYVA